MSATHEIPELDAAGLRKFGIMTGAIVAVLFGLFFPWLLERPIPVWPWAILAVLAAWGLVAPATLRPVYRGWMRFGLLMSRITTPLILGISFFLVVSPMAIVRRMLGKDSMARRLDPAATSYRVQSKIPDDDHLKRPY